VFELKSISIDYHQLGASINITLEIKTPISGTMAQIIVAPVGKSGKVFPLWHTRLFQLYPVRPTL
jgi:hypothetical protein